jgi:hypothetical protein
MTAIARLLEAQARRRPLLLAALLLAVTTLLALGPVLFAGGGRVLSYEDADLARQFVPWRAFGFGEMRHGHLPLWNPHIYGGAPFFGGFQSALLYPPNWLCLALPLAPAINWGIALHVWMAGMFTFLWMRGRGLHPLACLLAGVLFQFCGPFFLHIDAGHLPNLSAMVWGPLVLLSIDGWLDKRTAGWLLLGGGATAMQILAGHPQYVFYTGVAAAIYGLPRLAWTRAPWYAAAGLAWVPAIAVCLSAVQLLEGWHATAESVRSRGATFVFASLFSFPPENLVTALVPGFFGDLTDHLYWGRCLLWEMSLFFGVTGLALAVYGVLRGRRTLRFLDLAAAAALLLLATGSHTPLFAWLYHHVPGFDKFRGLSKFIYPAVLFLIALAAAGFDALWEEGRPPRAFVWTVAGAGVAIGLASVALMPLGDAGPVRWPWPQWINAVESTRETMISGSLAASSKFQRDAAWTATEAMLGSAGTLALIAVILAMARRKPEALALLPLVALTEMLMFAYTSLESFPLAAAQDSPAADYLAEHPAGGSRILNLEDANIAMSIGADDLWGYDPGVLRRYAEWMADSQGVDPAQLDEELIFTRTPALYASLLRCRYIFPPESVMPANGGALPVYEYPPETVSPHLLLVPEARILTGRAAIFDAMRADDFDPRRTVILEQPPVPSPAPGSGPPGVASVVAETTDSLTIDATLSRAAILLVTDNYCSGWMVRNVTGSAQARYDVMPGDYFLRAIPLAPGHHHFELIYRPLVFVIGAWISALSLILFAAACVYLLAKRRKAFVF